jgi:hypothetical protein
MGIRHTNIARQSSNFLSQISSTEMTVWLLASLVFKEAQQSADTMSVEMIKICSLMYLPEKLMRS